MFRMRLSGCTPSGTSGPNPVQRPRRMAAGLRTTARESILFICRASSTGRAGLGLALALAMLAPGVAGADPTPAWDKCPPAATPSAASASGGGCAWTSTSSSTATTTSTIKVKGGPAPSAPSVSAVPGIVNVSLNCGASCAAAPEPKASAVAEGVSWPAWAVAHLAADDAIRQQDHLFRGVLMIFAIVLAFVLGVYAAKLALRSAEQARTESDLRFTSHWGGFGGSTGGWQLTPALFSLLCAGVLAATAAGIVGCVLESLRPQTPAPSATPGLPAAGGSASEKK